MGDDDSTFTSPMVAQEPAAKTPRKAAAVVRVPADGASGASGSAGEQDSVVSMHERVCVELGMNI